MNVVFDLGGVVFAWRPDELLREVFADADARARVRHGLLGHPDWLELDRGSLDFDAAVQRGAARTGLAPHEIARFLDAVPPSLAPIPPTIDLIADVRAAGHRLYVLSNMHHASIDYLEREHAIWHLFDGTVISCRIGKVKPEKDIYQHLLAQFRLPPAATVFVDDLLENVAAAEVLGIRGIRFESPRRCREELRALGVLQA